MRILRASSRFWLRLTPLVALALLSAQSRGQASVYSIPVHSIDAGGQTLANRCFRLSGSLAETAPGYSSSGTYAVYAGFRAAASGRAVDEIFFAGFEEC